MMCGLCALDAILSHESENVQDRVLSLEKKVQQQDDEIVCLKSALADALRRLAALESGLAGCQFMRLSVSISDHYYCRQGHRTHIDQWAP